MVLGALTWTRASLTKWRATPPLTGRPIKRSTLTPRKWSHRGLRRTGAPKQPLLHTKPYPSKAPISSRHKQNVSKPNKKQKGQSKGVPGSVVQTNKHKAKQRHTDKQTSPSGYLFYIDNVMYSTTRCHYSTAASELEGSTPPASPRVTERSCRVVFIMM